MFFSDLSKYIKKGKVKNITTKKYWRSVPYETSEFSGNMLVSGECTRPKALTLSLPVTGKYKMYIGLPKLWHSSISSIEISFSKNFGKTCVSPYKVASGSWQAYEYIEESYFGEIDFTDNDIIINKPQGILSPIVSAISHIRLEKINDNIHVNSRTISYHFDTDYYNELKYSVPQDYLGRINCIQNGNGKRLILETSFDNCKSNYKKIVPNILSRKGIDRQQLKYLNNKEEIKRVQIEKAHSMGMEVFAGVRFTMSNFIYPYSETTYNDDTLDKLKEYSIYTRDNKRTSYLSFAYQEVRTIIINKILNMVNGFDGISLFFHRGMFVGFEKPIIDIVKEKYNIDAKLLPYTDKRLNSVYAKILTNFIIELKASLPNNFKIDIISLTDLKSSNNFGYCVENWAKEGLINSVSQGLMTNFEVVNNCLMDEDTSLIDLKKYTKENNIKPLFLRDYSDNLTNILHGAKQYLEIANKYNIDFFGALPWECSEPQKYLNYALELSKIGVKNFISWNANHICKVLPTINAVNNCGSIEQIEQGLREEYMKYYRVLSLDNCSISSFDPNWRG